MFYNTWDSKRIQELAERDAKTLQKVYDRFSTYQWRETYVSVSAI